MLTQLFIENIAVIKQAEINLTPGLNIFTGETGAGKTVLINAINSILGMRTSKDIIRTGQDRASVSAMFRDVSAEVMATARDMLGTEDADELVISREIFKDGRTNCKVNGRPVTVAMLAELAGGLVDIHGQNDNRRILAADKQLELLDSFGGLGEEFEHYRELYKAYRDTAERLASVDTDEAQKARRLDMLSFQIDEITSAELAPGEEEELFAERDKHRNREKITAAVGEMLFALEGSEEFPGILEGMNILSQNAKLLSVHYDEYEARAAKTEDCEYELRDLKDSLADLLEDLSYDPDRQRYAEERLDLINSLKKKYGGDIDEILAFLSRAEEEHRTISMSDELAHTLRERLDKEYAALTDAASVLSGGRRAAAEEFSRRAESELAFLDMPSVKFVWKFSDCEPGPHGTDKPELLIITNAGEAPKPLSKIASGGEIARIMLAVKNIMLDNDAVDTMIFDEIDTGVSGRAAQKIGRKLAEVAKYRQVICVTHLAPVAAFGQNHLLIAKSSSEDETFTRITSLNRSERVHELARIISGDNITDTALQNAGEMLELSADVL